VSFRKVKKNFVTAYCRALCPDGSKVIAPVKAISVSKLMMELCGKLYALLLFRHLDGVEASQLSTSWTVHNIDSIFELRFKKVVQ
jgi:hypothetical protein